MPAKERSIGDPPIVCLLATPESSPATLCGMFEVFSTFAKLWRELTGEVGLEAEFDVRVVACKPTPLAFPGGASITPDATLEATERTDVSIVTDLLLDLGQDYRNHWPQETAWLRQIHANGGIVSSVCTGAVLLASSGLLDGRTATTHWGAVDHIRANYPEVRLEPNRILAVAEPDERIITGGGVASWEEVALHLISRFYGRAAAVKASKIFLLGDRSDGQLVYAAPRSRPHDDAVIAASQEWIGDNYAEPSPVARMVERSGLPERTFKRRFRRATGYSPIDYIQTLRIEEAKQMLETSDDLVDAIACDVGYEDVSAFRRLFKRRVGVTPVRYRQRYQLVGDKGKS